MAKFRKKPIVADAKRAAKSGQISTLEGPMHYDAGDWIVTGVKGEKWPVKDGIFQETYDQVDSDNEDIVLLNIDQLTPNPLNRKIDPEKVDEIADAIKESHKIKPLVYTEIRTDDGIELMLTDGHHRYEALKQLDYEEVPAVPADERGVHTADALPPENVEKSLNKLRDLVGEAQQCIKSEGRKPCPPGYRRDEDGKCRSTSTGGYVASLPIAGDDDEESETDGETDTTTENNTTTTTKGMLVEKVRDLVSTLNKLSKQISETSVSGLDLTRDDLKPGIVNETPSRGRKEDEDDLKRMGPQGTTKRPNKNLGGNLL